MKKRKKIVKKKLAIADEPGQKLLEQLVALRYELVAIIAKQDKTMQDYQTSTDGRFRRLESTVKALDESLNGFYRNLEALAVRVTEVELKQKPDSEADRNRQ